MIRRFGIAAAMALCVLQAGMLLVATPPTAAAADATSSGLTLAGNATYDVLPDQAKVAVTVVLTATNTLKDTKTKRFFFRAGYVTVLPNTSNYRLHASSGKPKVTVSSKTATYVNLKLDFGANLAAGKSTTLTLTYDIKDPGGAADRPVRVSKSLVSFAAWAVTGPGTAGQTVTVRFPKGYDVLVRRGPLNGPTPDASGHDVWRSGALAAPLDFVADISADRQTDYAESQRTVALASGTAKVTMQAWPDDPAWETRVGSIVERALPILEREIGMPWPSDQPLRVREALVRSTGGYAGLYDPAEHRVDIAYAAPDAIVIHELAHAWFNGGLVADRWIAEGFASHYAELAAKELGIDPVPIAPPDDTAPPAPLNAWGQAAPDATGSESWGYAASQRVADAIAARAGEDRLRAVWQRAASGVGAYQASADGAEPAPGVPDWRGLLDLLEEATDTSFVDVWRQWVARPQDVAALDDRASALDAYRQAVEDAGEWRLPASIRAAMRAWRFDVARDQLAAAAAVLAQRNKLQSTAAAAELTLPVTLRATFEGGAGLDSAATEAAAEQAVVDAIIGARATRPGAIGVGEEAIVNVGLLFQHPEADLADAIAALGAGNLKPAYADATAARDAWHNAAENGRSRILSVILLTIATVVLLSLVRRALMPRRPRVSTLRRHPAGTAEDEGGAATKA